MKEKLLTTLRWIGVLPLSIIASYIVYMLFMWGSRSTGPLHTRFDDLWNYGMMFVSHFVMGATFMATGIQIAPSHKRVCSCVLFGFACVLAGVLLLANFMTGFSWVSLISLICLMAGVSYIFYTSLKKEEF